MGIYREAAAEVLVLCFSSCLDLAQLLRPFLTIPTPNYELLLPSI